MLIRELARLTTNRMPPLMATLPISLATGGTIWTWCPSLEKPSVHRTLFSPSIDPVLDWQMHEAGGVGNIAIIAYKNRRIPSHSILF